MDSEVHAQPLCVSDREVGMKLSWNPGDHGANVCPRCRQLVRTRFELRTVRLARSRLSVRDVLVDVCPLCDHMISIPPQSVPQLREAGVK